MKKLLIVFIIMLNLILTACGGSSGGNNNQVTKNALKDILTYSLNGTNGVITGNNIAVEMLYGTDVTALIATFTTDGESVKVNGVTQISAVTANNFTSPLTYTVTAANGTTQNCTVNVTVASINAKDIIAFSLNGTNGVITGNNIAVVIPYGTNITALVATFATDVASVKIDEVTQISGVTANNFTSPLTYTVTAADGSIKKYIVTVTIASDNAKDIIAFSLNGTNGVITGNNIAVEMPYGTDITDLITTFTTDGEIVKVNGITQTSTLTAHDFTNPITYTVTAANGTTQNYTVNVTVALNSAKDIIVFSLEGTNGVITGNNIAVEMPYGTDVTDLIATFTTDGASVKVGGVLQTSTLTTNNFTSPAVYKVTAANGTIQNYTVNVTVALNSAKDIIAFSLNGTPGVITSTNIVVSMPLGTDKTSLIATFTTDGASIKVNAINQTSTVTANDFTNSVIYTVTAANGTTQNYNVTVNLNSAFLIVGNTRTGYNGVIATYIYSTGSLTNLYYPSQTPNSIAVSSSGKYVAVGQNGLILSSDDGNSWIVRSSSVSSNLNSVTFGSNKFVAVGKGGKIIYSTDNGVSWLLANSNTTEELNSVIFSSYGSSKFVAVGEDGLILNSNDGINWVVVVPSPAQPYDIYTVAVNDINGNFVAIGRLSAYYSNNGATWTSTSFGNQSNASITFGNGKFVVVGYNDIQYSSDGGTNWPSASIFPSGGSNTFIAVAISSLNKFVAAGYGSFVYSNNGTSWTRESANLGVDVRGIVAKPFQ